MNTTQDVRRRQGWIMRLMWRSWPLLVAFGLVVVCMLGFYEPTSAAAQAGKQPFRNPVAQREEMIGELKALRLLVKEQNQLLRSIYQQNAKSKPR